MQKIIALFLIIAAFSVFDIRKMKEAGLKKEIAVYLGYMFAAAAIGLQYFLNPDSRSIVNILLSIFNIGE